MSRGDPVAGWWRSPAGTIYTKSQEMLHPFWKTLNLRAIELDGALRTRAYLAPVRNAVIGATPKLEARCTMWLPDRTSVRNRQDPNRMTMRQHEHWLACVLRNCSGGDQALLKETPIRVTDYVVREGTERDRRPASGRLSTGQIGRNASILYWQMWAG